MQWRRELRNRLQDTALFLVVLMIFEVVAARICAMNAVRKRRLEILVGGFVGDELAVRLMPEAGVIFIVLRFSGLHRPQGSRTSRDPSSNHLASRGSRIPLICRPFR